MIKEMPVVYHGMAAHIMDCPIQMREWNGKIYANLIDDCFNCEHFKDAIGDETTTHKAIVCAGHQDQIKLDL